MASHLYIIGNGFDKHHDIPSGYQDYRHWLEREGQWDILDIIDDVFGYVNDDWWQHFESNLASAETLRIAIEETFQNYPKFDQVSEWYDAELSVERKMRNAYEIILHSFDDWVKHLLNIKIYKKMTFDAEDSIFLSFNYTTTLETLYNIPSQRILYIHGKVGSENGLVIGHGISYKEIERRMGETVDTGDYAFQLAKDAAVCTVSKHKKKVGEIIESNQKWFSSLSNISYIHIYGHSLGDVDLPYFYRIFECVDTKSLQIEISDYKNQNKKRIHQIMKEAHLHKDQYKIVEFLSLCPKTTLNKIF
jgi:hypothetical protein